MTRPKIRDENLRPHKDEIVANVVSLAEVGYTPMQINQIQTFSVTPDDDESDAGNTEKAYKAELNFQVIKFHNELIIFMLDPKDPVPDKQYDLTFLRAINSYNSMTELLEDEDHDGNNIFDYDALAADIKQYLETNFAKKTADSIAEHCNGTMQHILKHGLDSIDIVSYHASLVSGLQTKFGTGTKPGGMGFLGLFAHEIIGEIERALSGDYGDLDDALVSSVRVHFDSRTSHRNGAKGKVPAPVTPRGRLDDAYLLRITGRIARLSFDKHIEDGQKKKFAGDFIKDIKGILANQESIQSVFRSNFEALLSRIEKFANRDTGITKDLSELRWAFDEKTNKNAAADFAGGNGSGGNGAGACAAALFALLGAALATLAF